MMNSHCLTGPLVTCGVVGDIPKIAPPSSLMLRSVHVYDTPDRVVSA